MKRVSSNQPPNSAGPFTACCVADIPNQFWKTFHVEHHATRTSSQRKCCGFHMSRTAKTRSRRHFTAKTNRQEGGSGRLTEARGRPRRRRKTGGLEWNRAEIKNQIDLQPLCLLLLLLPLAPSYQPAEGSTPLSHPNTRLLHLQPS